MIHPHEVPEFSPVKSLVEAQHTKMIKTVKQLNTQVRAQKWARLLNEAK
jgi:hypothetical protein